MQKIIKYVQESYSELMTKVSWPTWSELQSSAGIVTVASMIIALVVFAMDFAFGIRSGDSAWKGVLGFFYEMF